MAQAQGPSQATIRRIWKQHNLKPHLVKTFKLSRDKHFLEKLMDVVGLYLNPPDKSLVLCVDEKSQIQALDRTQPGLPLKKGRCGTMTHDYKRIRRGSFASVPELIAAIKGYLENHNQNPKVFTWSASVERIMTKVAKCKEALDSLH